MSLVVCDNSLHHRDHDERKLFYGGSSVAGGAQVGIGVRVSGRMLKWWKMKMSSFRLEILGSLAREVAVLEDVEQLGGLDGTALENSAGHGFLKAVVRPVVEGSALDALWGLRDSRSTILAVQEEGLELKRGVWRGEGLERGNTWAFLPPS